jgi:hypothetical protein
MKFLWILVLIPMLVTYGGMYSEAQHWSGGYLSHEKNTVDHLRALNWAIFPPMWIIAPIITSGYREGFEFRHHHGHFCGKFELPGSCEASW